MGSRNNMFLGYQTPSISFIGSVWFFIESGVQSFTFLMADLHEDMCRALIMEHFLDGHFKTLKPLFML